MAATTTEEFKIETLLGPTLLTKVKGPKKATATLMKDKDLVLLYFSASWCPPCKAFSPILIDFYNKSAKEGKVEIVYISSDKSVAEFEGYYKKMPWLSIPSEAGSASVKNSLAQSLGIQGIPTLVVIDAKTGEFVSATAREDVTPVGGDATKGKELIATWKAMERKPLSEASSMVGGSQNILVKILLWFAKNPMSVFALLYMYKYAKRKWSEMNGIEEDDDDEEEIPPPAGDSEF